MPEAITEFNPAAPAAVPTKPDLINEGMIFNLPAAPAAPQTSKSVRVTDRPGAWVKSLYVQSDKAGAFDIEVLLDESEIVTGAAVWRKYQTGVAIAANTLKVVTISDLFRQARIVLTPSSGPAVVKAWFFSIP